MEDKYRPLQKKIDELFGIAARRELEINTIREISTALSHTLERDELLPKIMEEITRLMDADRATLYLYDRENNELWSKVLLGEGLKEIRLKLGEGIAGWVAENNATLNIEDAYSDERFNASFDKKSGYKTKSILCLPVLDPEDSQGKSIIAVIQILNKKNGNFRREDEFLLEVISSQVAIALKNSELYTQLKEKAADLDLLYKLERLFSEADSLEGIFDKVIELVSIQLEAEAGSILLKRESEDSIYFKASFGEKSSELTHLSIPSSKGVVGWVVQNNQATIVEDPDTDERFNRDVSEKIDFPTKNILCVPLRSDNIAIGAIEVINKNVGGFTKDDLRLLELIASQLARAIEIVNLRVKREQEDRLTMLGNIMSTVLHDLRTPVNNIHGFVALLNTPDTSEKEREEFVEIINNQIDSVLSMTKEILDFVKGKTAILPRRISAGQFFERFKKEFSIIAEEHSHKLIIDDPPPLWLYIDPDRMIRAIQNLVKNAVEALTEPGTIEISLRHIEGENWAIMYVRDNGPGIPEEIRSKVFESFSSSGKENGTGLGLAIVKKIIEEHGGEISFKTSSSGTSFHLTLPISDN